MSGFDKTKYVLGKLCPAKHEWNNTGRTLKQITKVKGKTKSLCPICSKEAKQKSYSNKTQKERLKRVLSGKTSLSILSKQKIVGFNVSQDSLFSVWIRYGNNLTIKQNINTAHSKVCSHGHYWLDEQHSLRFIKSKNMCVVCCWISHLKAVDLGKNAERRARHYKKHKEAHNADILARYYRNHEQKLEYGRSEKVKERARQAYREQYTQQTESTSGKCDIFTFYI